MHERKCGHCTEKIKAVFFIRPSFISYQYK
jgi:hypothetical protein